MNRDIPEARQSIQSEILRNLSHYLGLRYTRYVIAPLIGNNDKEQVRFTRKLAKIFLGLDSSRKYAKNIFKSESGCMVLLKVLAFIGDDETGKDMGLKEAIYKKIVTMIMDDIIVLSKANHTHQTLNMLFKFWTVGKC